MKKRAAVLLALAFFLLLAGVYFLAPVRPALAGATANRHIQERYGAYELPPVEESLSVELRGRRALGVMVEWVAEYGASAENGQYLAVVNVNGWLPLLVEESRLYETSGNEAALLEEYLGDE